MILVVGSTGLLGKEITRQLAENNFGVRALVRKDSDETKVEVLRDFGVEIVYGDLKSDNTLKEACKGVSKVISTASSTFSRNEGDSIQTVDHDGQINLVNASEEAGVNQFVFISFPEVPKIDFPLSRAKRSVERALTESTMDWCSLQASYFMEIWISPLVGFDYQNFKARIYGTGEQKINWISYKDVASLAVASLDNPYFRKKAVQIGGPRAVSPNEIIQIFETAMGHSFEVEYVPVEALNHQRSEAKTPLEESFTALMQCYARGDSMNMVEILENIPLHLITVEEFIDELTK